MQELSCEERADTYDVFKDIQHREIFMTVDPSSSLIWLKKKIVSGNYNKLCLLVQLLDGSKSICMLRWQISIITMYLFILLQRLLNSSF
jgi:hypothetical protein